MRLQELEAQFGFDSDALRVRAPLNDWSERLRSVCGGFTPVARHHANEVTGGVLTRSQAGLRLVQVATDVDFVSRDSRSIRVDYSDHLFLLLQLEGVCGADQFGRQNVIGPGDCILVDSAYPVKLSFEGRYSNHISVHLPRHPLVGDRADAVNIGVRLAAEDPLAGILRTLVAKIMRFDVDQPRGPQLRRLMLHAIKESFAAEAAQTLAVAPAGPAKRAAMAGMAGPGRSARPFAADRAFLVR